MAVFSHAGLALPAVLALTAAALAADAELPASAEVVHGLLEEEGACRAGAGEVGEAETADCGLSFRQLRGELRTAEQHAQGPPPEAVEAGGRPVQPLNTTDLGWPSFCHPNSHHCDFDFTCCSGTCGSNWTCLSKENELVLMMKRFCLGWAEGFLTGGYSVTGCIEDSKDLGQNGAGDIKEAMEDFEDLSMDGLKDGFSDLAHLLKTLFRVLEDCLGDVKELVSLASILPSLLDPALFMAEFGSKLALQWPKVEYRMSQLAGDFAISNYKNMGERVGQIVRMLLP